MTGTSLCTSVLLASTIGIWPSCRATAESSSPNYRLAIETLNTSGVSATSASFSLSRCLAPDPIAGGRSCSASFRMEIG